MFIKTMQKIDRTNNITPLIRLNGYNYYQVDGNNIIDGAEEVELSEITSEIASGVAPNRLAEMQSQIDDISAVIADIVGGAL